ncbi:MAG: hypothetical protein NZ703_14585 [Gemmataceae bacterium]|nr:hypothetical protein [Gemmataceae bacterium]MCS7272307.1 hypothetical protein [Gemmataceae bacterium]MDW8241840.1 hypothetical protein [Thermogemmata sp.]
MPWVVGIDEAGYGPVLGPLVQAAVVVRLPAEDPSGWQTLQSLIRRVAEPADHRVLIDDSKQVYGRYGWSALECGVARTLHWSKQPLLQWLMRQGVAGTVAALKKEPWFQPQETYPEEDWPPLTEEPFPVWARVRILTPAVFNWACDQLGNKAETLGQGWIELVRSLFTVTADQPSLSRADGQDVLILSDKLGGRHYYAGLVAACFPHLWVTPLQEGAVESRYCLEEDERRIMVCFQPEAESQSVAVALASMLAKYVREICMRQFNRYWQRLLPDLPCTSGYLPHARHWYTRIVPFLRQQGLRADDVWRRR